MITDLLNKEFFKFISDNKNEDPLKLALKLNKKNVSFPLDFALIQIAARKKHEKKLSDFFNNPKNLVADSVIAEQASHQAIGIYHSSLINQGDTVLDLTAGLGIDTFYMSKKARQIDAVELDNIRSEILNYNIKLNNLDNIKVFNTSSELFLSETDNLYDTIFIDPDRRDKDKKRVYDLKDSTPNIYEILPRLTKICKKKILIKCSPMIDLNLVIKDFPMISCIKCISVKGECKEVLLELPTNPSAPQQDKEITIEAVDLYDNGSEKYVVSKKFNETNSLEKEIYVKEEELGDYGFIYEPDPVIMKVSPWKYLVENYKGIKKLAENSHLFVSKNFFENFPGRKLKITGLINKSNIKTIEKGKFNIVSKNYPLSAESFRKQYKIKEGKENFIYATKIGEKPILFTASLLL